MAARRRRRRREVEVEEQPKEEAVVEETKDPEPEPEPEEAPEPEEKVEEEQPASRARSRKAEADEVTSAELLDAILGGLGEGESVTITEAGDGKYQLSSGATIEVAQQPVPAAKVRRVSWDVFYTDEFKEWQDGWSEKTYEEKMAYAEENDIEWTRNDNENIDHKNVGVAVKKAEGIEKYKKGFESPKSRKNAKAILEAGGTVEGLDV